MPETCYLAGDENLLVCEDLTNFSNYEEKLFQIFLQLYEQSEITYHGTPVYLKHYPPDYGEKSSFYHLTCENYQHTGNENDRSPNLRRCERLKWPKSILEVCDSNCPQLLKWENVRHGKKNILLLCPELDYLVVLSKRNNYLLLTTAYPVTYHNRREDLLKEYTAYKQTTHSV